MKKITTSLLVAMSLAATVVLVAGPASASPTTTTKKKPTTTKTTTTKKTTTKKTTPKTTDTTSASLTGSIPDVPGSHFFVINGTANAASDHEIAGSTAFPNFRTGAVDNYYSMTHAHVDNSPFAEGTASPADTGPIGQTAAAGNFQQPQYADARWPGDAQSGTATVGTQGQPYASAKASEYSARGEASEASQGFNGPSGPSKMAAPKGFDLRLRQVLAAWKAKWQGPLGLPKPGTLGLPKPGGIVKKPTGTVTTPTVPIPIAPAPITTPTVPLGGVQTPPPPATVPLPPVPRSAARETTTSSRSLASAPAAPAAPGSGSGSGSASADGMSHLESTAATRLDQQANTLVTAGESTLGRVSLGGGQIVIKGIYVSAMISNDGTPTYKAVVDIADASIGGVPVTIDQDGVHLAGQSQGAPYQQASDGLNAALKQAGIQLFLVGPEVTKNTCDQSSPGGGTGGDQSGGMPSSNSCDQSNMTSSSCDQSGSGSGTTTTTASGPPSLTPTTTTTNPCDQSSSCSQTSSTSGTTSTTTTTAAPTAPTSTNSKNHTSTTSTTSSCDTGMSTPTSTCTQSGTTPTTTSSYGQTGTTSTTMTSSGMDTFAGTANSSGEMTVTATGLHVVFTQPAGAPSGVPAQNAEHILGEVFLDSLAVPATPAGPLPNLNLNSSSSPSSSSFSSSSSSSSCLGGLSSGSKSSGGVASGSFSAGGSNSSGSLSPSGYASTSQPGSSASGSPLGTSLAHLASWARRKPKWLLLSYLVWQALALAAAASLWKWQGEGAS